jgi:hypothetical protein
MKYFRVTGIGTTARCSRALAKGISRSKVLINQKKPNEIFRSPILWENVACLEVGGRDLVVPVMEAPRLENMSEKPIAHGGRRHD